MRRLVIILSLIICHLSFSEAQERIILLNEGMWQADNGMITYFQDGQVVSNQWFRDVNGQKLGDTPNDIIHVNQNLIAIAINWSNVVQFITPDGKAVAAIENIPNNRKLCSDGKYVYVTSYGHECETVNGTQYFEKGFVAKIDISTFKVIATCEVGYEPEGIALYEGRLFVANTGGYAGQEDHEYETTVSIINAGTMIKEKDIDTQVPNLYGKMSQCGQYLCINSPGDYYGTPACGLIFDCKKALRGEDCFAVFDYPVTYNCTTLDGKFLAIGSSYSYLTSEYEFTYLTIDPQLVIESHAEQGLEQTLPGTLGTDFADMSQPYGIYVNPYSGYIYGTDAGTYEGAGTLYQWSPEGKLLGKHKVYINPAHFLALAPEGYWDSLNDPLPSSPRGGEQPIYDIMGRKIDSSLFTLHSSLIINAGKKILYNK
jgi:DNA-binding beta-propeller fold protein YncE